MATINNQIKCADEAICENIKSLSDHRALLSKNILSQLRNLIEGVAVRLHLGSPSLEFNYAAVGPAIAFVSSRANFSFLSKFHKLIQKIASHFTFDGDTSERLMLKYFENLYRIRSLLRNECGMAVLTNLEDFPINLDPSLREYHEKIAARIEFTQSTTSDHRIAHFFTEAGCRVSAI